MPDGVQFEQPRATARLVRFFAWYFVVAFAFLTALSIWSSATGHPVLGAFAAFVWLELGLFRLRSMRFAGTVVYDETTSARVAPMLLDLCERMPVAAPSVVLRSDRLRAAAVFQRRGEIRLVLSNPYAHQISDDELRAILAHELAHLVHRDLMGEKRRAFVAMFAAVFVAVVIALTLETAEDVAAISGALWIFTLLLCLAALSPSNKPRELRADAEAARITGNPGAVPAALDVAHTMSTEQRNAFYSNLFWRVVLAPVAW